MKCRDCKEEYAEDVYIYCPFCMSDFEMGDDGDMPMFTFESIEGMHVEEEEEDFD